MSSCACRRSQWLDLSPFLLQALASIAKIEDLKRLITIPRIVAIPLPLEKQLNFTIFNTFFLRGMEAFQRIKSQMIRVPQKGASLDINPAFL